jgi:hypothetical protein
VEFYWITSTMNSRSSNIQKTLKTRNIQKDRDKKEKYDSTRDTMEGEKVTFISFKK